MFKKFTFFLNYPKTTLTLITFLSLFFFWLISQNIVMETDLDEYMPKTHPAFVYSQKAENWFNIKDAVIIALENPQGIYQPSTLEKIRKITVALQKMKEIKKNDVTSLYTADNIIGSESGLEVRSFYKKVPESPEEIEMLKKNVAQNEMVFGKIVSRDEKVTVIMARIDDHVFSETFYHQILKLKSEFQGPEKIYVGGTPIVEGSLAQLAPKDMKKMAPIVVVVIIIVLLLVTRSVRAASLILLVVLFSTIWAFGLMGLFKIPMYSVSTMIPVMLIAIGVADGIHMYNHLRIFITTHPDSSPLFSIKNMLSEMWKPVVMTSVTTAIGFISLLTSEVYPIKYFGLFTAYGVMVAMLLSLVIIPCGFMIFGIPRVKSSEKIKNEKKLGDRLSSAIFRYQKTTIMITILVTGAAIFGTTKVWINSGFLEKFETDSDVVQTDSFLNQNFGGTTTLNMILESKNPDSFKNPQVLNLMDDIQQKVLQVKKVGNSFSIADYLKRMNKVMNEDQKKYHRIPESSDLIAQYLLLYEMSGDPENLWQIVDSKYQKANLSIQLKSDDSKTLQEVISFCQSYEKDFEKHGITINFAGSGYKTLVFTGLILEGQIISLFTSLLIIIIMLTLMFKKITIGLVGSIPIILTAIISFGVMGLLDIPLSSTTALISSIAVGIGIDYAIHFIERYKIYSLQLNDPLIIAKKTINHSGRAILFNAAIVISGFLVLLFSVFPPNRVLGALVSLNMFTSLLGTITIMLVFLLKIKVFPKTKKN